MRQNHGQNGVGLHDLIWRGLTAQALTIPRQPVWESAYHPAQILADRRMRSPEIALPLQVGEMCHVANTHCG
jgi:hypothetical protein